MVASAIYDTQDKLAEIISAALITDAETAKVRVSVGVPIKPGKEEVWISGEVDDWEQNYPYSGLTAKEEEFTLRVCIVSMRLGLDYVANRNRVRVISTLIEQAIHADPTLDGTVELATVRSPRLEEALLTERERAVALNFDVIIRAHLRA